MIVDSGTEYLLSIQLGLVPDNLQAALWGLFTAPAGIDRTTVFTSLTEAAWTGYARVTVGSLAVPAMVSGRATSSPGRIPQFSNTSGAGQSFAGWFLLAADGATLIACDLIPAGSVPDTGVFDLLPVFSDRQEL